MRVGPAVLAYVVVFAVLGFPWLRVATHAIPTGTFLVSSGDACMFTWVLAWVAHALATDPRHLFDANIFFPAPRQLTGHDAFFSTQLVFGPLFALTGNALLSANLVALLSYPVAALAMQRLLLALGFSPGVAWVTGLIYALGPLAVPGNLHVIQYLGVYLPALALCLVRLRERPDARRAALLAVALALGVLSSYYLAVILAVGGAVWAVAELARRRGERPAFVWHAGLAATLAFLALMAVSLPYLQRPEASEAAAVMPADFTRLVPFMDAPGMSDVAHLALASGGSPTLMSPAVLRDPQSMASITWSVARLSPRWYGSLLPLLAATGVLALGMRGPSGSAARRGLVLVVVGALLMLGPVQYVGQQPIPLPLALLGVSPARFFRFPWRFIVLAGFGSALLTAAGLEAIGRRAGPRRAAWMLAVVAGALLATRGAAFLAVDSLDIPGQTLSIYDVVRDVAAREGAGPLLELPVPENTKQSHHWDAMIGSTRHWLPLVTGNTTFPPPHRAVLDRTLARLPASEALDDLVDMTHVRWLLLRPSSDWSNPTAREALLRLDAVDAVAERDGWTLVRVARAPRGPDWFAAIAAGGVPSVPVVRRP